MIVEVNPVAFYLPIPLYGWWPIYWYGISWLVAILSINYFSKISAPNIGVINKNLIEDFLFYGVLGAILGGRLGYMIFYGINQIQNDFLSIFRIWEGGLSFHGGLIGVLISFYLFTLNKKVNFFNMTDHMAVYFPLGLGSVRIGNFLGGELLGRPTDMPWGMTFSSDPLGLSRHPSQLYQAFLEGVILFFILYFLSKKKLPKMFISGYFLIFYGTFRIISENFRTPDQHIGFDLFNLFTRGQLLSIPMILCGLAIIYIGFKKNRNETVS